MNDKDKQSVTGGLATAATIIVFIYMSTIQNFLPVLENGILFVLFALIIGLIIYGIVWNLIPTKKNKKNNNKVRKNASNKNNNLAKKSNFKPPNNRQLPDHEIIKLDLKDISAKELERLCCMYYISKGYKAEETKRGADGGIDIIYYHPEHGKTAVQVKHYLHSGKKINVDEIRKLNSAKLNYGCVFTEFITTSTYTSTAKAEAPTSMETRDIYWFERVIIPWMKKEALKHKKTS